MTGPKTRTARNLLNAQGTMEKKMQRLAKTSLIALLLALALTVITTLMNITVLVAMPWVRHPVGPRTGIQNAQLAVHRQQQLHAVQRLAHPTQAISQGQVTVLQVLQLGLYIEQAVRTGKHLHVDASTVQQLALGGGDGRHKTVQTRKTRPAT